MKVADLMKKKNLKVNVRVPAPQQAQFGETTQGVVQGVVPSGAVTWVEVKIPRRGVHRFRPQDLTAA